MLNEWEKLWWNKIWYKRGVTETLSNSCSWTCSALDKSTSCTIGELYMNCLYMVTLNEHSLWKQLWSSWKKTFRELFLNYSGMSILICHLMNSFHERFIKFLFMNLSIHPLWTVHELVSPGLQSFLPDLSSDNSLKGLLSKSSVQSLSNTT